MFDQYRISLINLYYLFELSCVYNSMNLSTKEYPMNNEQKKTIYEVFEPPISHIDPKVNKDALKDEYFKRTLSNYTPDNVILNRAFKLFKEIELIEIKPNTLYNFKLEYLIETAVYMLVIDTLAKLHGFSVIGFYYNAKYYFVFLNDSEKYSNLFCELDKLSCITHLRKHNSYMTEFNTEFETIDNFIELMKLINPDLTTSIEIKIA